MKENSKILLLFDFDGTISPIVADPRDAILPNDVKRWLNDLIGKKNIILGIVTGRALIDITKKMNLANIIYAANHGMEIYWKGRLLLQKGGCYKKPLSQLAIKLEPLLRTIPGVVIESKGLSFAVHFRKVRNGLRKRVKKIVRETSAPWLKKQRLQLTSGKMILEVRPALHWNKGKAALWIWKTLAPKYVPFYIGDDITDEDAFAALRPYGVTIRIGKKKDSHAEFCVPSIKTIMGYHYFTDHAKRISSMAKQHRIY